MTKTEPKKEETVVHDVTPQPVEPAKTPGPAVDPKTEVEVAKPVVIPESVNDYNEMGMPITLGHKLRMAKVFVESKLMPKGMETAQQVCVALQMGHELGLSPLMAVNNIHVINQKPSMAARLMMAIVMKQPSYAGHTITGTKDSCTVVIKRKINGEIVEFTGSFSMEDAKQAELLGKDNWKKFPKDMLKSRAMSITCRDAYPDALVGIVSTEEAENTIFMNDEQEKVDPSVNMFNMIVATINQTKGAKKKAAIAKENIEMNNVLTEAQKEELKKYIPLEQ